MKHAYINKKGDKLVVVISEEKVPTLKSCIKNKLTQFAESDLMKDLIKSWLKKNESTTYEVHPDVTRQLQDYINSLSKEPSAYILVNHELIKIETCRLSDDEYEPKEYAFFLQPEEKDLWPSDNIIEQEAVNQAQGSLTWEDGFDTGIKWLKGYCKQNGLKLVKTN